MTCPFVPPASTNGQDVGGATGDLHRNSSPIPRPRSIAPRMGKLRAVVYLADGDVSVDTRRCLHHCDAHGYDIDSIVIDNGDGTRWRAAVEVLAAGSADIIVASSSRAALLVPRIEVAGQHLPTQNRRPRRL